MSKKTGFFMPKIVLIVAIVIVLIIGATFAGSIYNKSQSDKKAQDIITQQKQDAIKAENQKQVDLAKKAEQEKLAAAKALEDEKKVEQQKVLDEAKKVAEEKKVAAEKVKAAEAAAIIAKENAKVTKDGAVKIINKIVVGNKTKEKAVYDHDQNRAGVDYFVIRVYEDMIDHINTLGWYYVQADNGKAFQWDLIKDTLTAIN